MSCVRPESDLNLRSSMVTLLWCLRSQSFFSLSYETVPSSSDFLPFNRIKYRALSVSETLWAIPLEWISETFLTLTSVVWDRFGFFNSGLQPLRELVKSIRSARSNSNANTVTVWHSYCKSNVLNGKSLGENRLTNKFTTKTASLTWLWAKLTGVCSSRSVSSGIVFVRGWKFDAFRWNQSSDQTSGWCAKSRNFSL